MPILNISPKAYIPCEEIVWKRVDRRTVICSEMFWPPAHQVILYSANSLAEMNGTVLWEKGSGSGRTRLVEQDTRNKKYLLQSLKIQSANQPHCWAAGIAGVFPSVNSACAHTLFLSVSCLLISPYMGRDEERRPSTGWLVVPWCFLPQKQITYLSARKLERTFYKGMEW